MKAKRFISGLSALAVAVSAFAGVALTASAQAKSRSFNFEDGNAVFTGDSRITVAIENNAGINSNVVGFTCAGNAQNGYSFAHYSFADLVVGAETTTIEFDYYNTNGGRAIVSLGDADVRGTTGGSSKVTYSNTGVAFNIGSDKNNARIQDTNYELAAFTNKWLHVNVIVDEIANTLSYTVKDAADNELKSASNVQFLNSNALSVSQIDLFGYINNSHCAMIDNLSITAELSESAMYDITYIIDGVSTTETVTDGSYPTKVPSNTSKTGYLFRGWKVGDTEDVISSADVAATAVKGNITYTAVYDADPNYIEELAGFEFTTVPSGNMLVPGVDENTPADNIFVVRATGELGSDLTAAPDSRVQDYSISYEVKGFNWKSHDKAPTEDSAQWPYCDSYGQLVTDGATANFRLKNHSFNYYGQIIATVTYNGKTMTASKPLVFIGNSGANTNAAQILPRGGYYEDANAFSPDMVGYQATISSDNRTATDIVTDNWAAYGGNTKTLTIAEDEGGRFYQFEATGTNSSAFAVNRIAAVTDTQVVFDQMVRFYNNATILLKTDNPVTWGTNSTTFTLSFNGSALDLNGSVIADAVTGTWYRILITSDVTSGKCYAELYSAEGEKLGESDIVGFTNAGSTNPTYYCYRTPDRARGKIDFNKVKITRAVIDEATINTTATAYTIAIPEAGKDPVSETLTISADTTDGLPAIGEAVWSVGDETSTGVTITPSAEDSHVAEITVEAGAAPGELPVNITMGGKTTQMIITLSSSQDSVKFIESESSVSIPLSAKDVKEYSYRAIVVNGDGEEIEGKTVTYALYDSKNANPISAPAGTSFENGVLTVTSSAKAATIYVRATSTNSENETITKSIKVDIHGLAFDFGAGTDEDVAAGFTSVTSSSAYTEKVGYGIDGIAVAGGEGSTDDAAADYLEGTYTFKANVEKGKFYTVKITYSGILKTGYVNSDLAGYTLGEQENLTEAEYTVAGTRDYIDLIIDEKDSSIPGRIAQITITQQADRTPGLLPSIYHVGDSTSANNGSWAYTLGDSFRGKDFTDADGNVIAKFYSRGAGSRNLGSYYTEGKLASVINDLRPGDILMLGNMGTNGLGTSFKDNVNYYLDAAQAMGAKVILNSYTPHGAVSNYSYVYDSETNTFEGWRQDTYDVIIREVAAERAANDPNYLGFVEIGKNADSIFNAYVADYAANGYASADAAAQAIIECFGDHNHYGNDGRSKLAGNLMINGYGEIPGIAAQIAAILTGEEAPKELVIDSFVLDEGAARAVVTNNTDAAVTVEIIAAVHDLGGALAEVKLDKKTIAAGETQTLTAVVTANGNVSAYLWNAENNQPLADAK